MQAVLEMEAEVLAFAKEKQKKSSFLLVKKYFSYSKRDCEKEGKL